MGKEGVVLCVVRTHGGYSKIIIKMLAVPVLAGCVERGCVDRLEWTPLLLVV